MTRNRCLLVLVAAALLVAPATFAQDTGSADFSRFVILGDSLGSGFTSGGLVEGVQRNSVPNLIYRQATGGELEQPLVTSPGIPALIQLQNLSPLVIAPRPGIGAPANLTLPRPYDNLSVPGFRIGDSIRTLTGNPVIDLVLRGLASQLNQAASLQPTLAMIWLGNNDVLGAATSGIVIEGVTLTPIASFAADYAQVAGTMQAVGADLIVVTLPDVTDIPFVNTLPPVIVDPATQQPVIVNGAPVPLIGPQGPLGPNDKVLLTAQSELAVGKGIPAALGGTGQPLSDSSVLSASEVTTIRNRTNAYNDVIRATAAQTGAALVDLAAVVARFSRDGVKVGGATLTADFLTGGLFSYDGVHGTSIGYGVIANEFIRAINARFGGNIRPVNLRPLMFTPDPGAIDIALTARTAFYYSPSLADNLRLVFQLPSATELERLKAATSGGKPGSGRTNRPGGNNGGGGGGEEVDGEDPPSTDPPEGPTLPRPTVEIGLGGSLPGGG